MTNLRKSLEYRNTKSFYDREYIEILEELIKKNQTKELKLIISEYELYLSKIEENRKQSDNVKMKEKIERFKNRIDVAKKEQRAFEEDKKLFVVGDEVYWEYCKSIIIEDIFKDKYVVGSSLYEKDELFSSKESARGSLHKDKNKKIILTYPKKIQDMEKFIN